MMLAKFDTKDCIESKDFYFIFFYEDGNRPG